MRRTGFRANDAQTRYLEMGSPQSLSPTQLAALQATTTDVPEQRIVVRIERTGTYALPVPTRTNDVVLALLEPVDPKQAAG